MKLSIALFVVATLPALAFAHHSTGGFYDRSVTVEITGTVKEFFWRNPHVGLMLEVENDAGEFEMWDIEGGAWNSVQRNGVTPETVTAGETIRVAGAPARQDVNAIFATHMQLSSGEEFVLSDRKQPPRWADQTAQAEISASVAAAAKETASGIFRVWSYDGNLYRLRAPLALTAAAQALQDQWDQTRDDPGLRCDAPGMPNAVLNPYPIQLIDEGDQIRLLIEEWDGNRVIYMNPATTPTNPSADRLGHSVGRWEGNTLVVQIDHVSWPYLDDSGTPMSDNVTMIERFTLSADETGLDYEVTVTDPANLIEPAVWVNSYVWIPGADVKPFECTQRQTGGSVYDN